VGSTTGAGGTPPPAPADDIGDAMTALTSAGFTDSEAISCLEALLEAGFMVTRGPTLAYALLKIAQGGNA
jgi:hypothetical protein